MKQLRFLFLLAFCWFTCCQVSAQNPALFKTYAGQRIDRMLQLPDGGFLLAGIKPGNPQSVCFLLRVDAEGDSLWSKNYLPVPAAGAATALRVNMLAHAPGNEVFLGLELLNSEIFPYLLRIDGMGNVLSETYIGHQPVSKFFNMFPVADSSVVAVYNTFATGPGYWVQKISPQGELLDLSSFAFMDTFFFMTVCYNPYDSSLFWGGSSFWANTSNDSLQNIIAKTDLQGNLLWKTPFAPEKGYASYRQVIHPWGSGAVLAASNPQANNDGMHLASYVAGPTGSPIYQHVYDTTARHFRTVTNVYSDNSPWIVGQDDLRAFILKTDDNVYLEWLKYYFDLPGAYSTVMELQAGRGNGLYYACGHFNQDGFLIQINAAGDVFAQKITGQVYSDLDQNCLPGASEAPLPGFVVEATGRDGRIWRGISLANGHFQINVPVDTYQIHILPFSGDTSIWRACPYPQTLILTTPGDTIDMGTIGFRSKYDCPLLQVRLNGGLFRPCMPVSFQVSWCNLGNVAPLEGIIALEMDTAFHYQSSSLPLLSSSGNRFLFRLDSAAALTCGDFNVQFNLSCGPGMGQILCATARIYPDTLCDPNPLWDGSDLDVSGVCQGDSVVFRVRNAGAGNMAAASGFIIIEDEVIMRQGQIRLPAGQDSLFVAPQPNGKTYILRVQQRPGKPGAAFASQGVEACGGAGGGGFLLQYPLGNGDLSEDTYCAEVRTSFDPNDKQGFPLGYDDAHWIEKEQEIQYRVRFQNTGNDTAFVVVIRDTLQSDLDLASFRFNGASHPCECSILGSNVLKCLFRNILLPDSSTNEAASHGYVDFTLRPKADLPNGTAVYNRAGIYFDFNPVVMTNQTVHTVGENFIPVLLTNDHEPAARQTMRFSPNPSSGAAELQMDEAPHAYPMWFTLFDLQGQEKCRQEVSAQPFYFRHGKLPSGLYIWRLQGADGNMLGSGKLVLR